MREIAGIRIPDSRLTVAALDLVKIESHASIYKHVLRTFVFGGLAARAEGILVIPIVSGSNRIMSACAPGTSRPRSEDALWESPGLGRFEGREAIKGFFREASGIFSFAIHYSLNGHIEVDGDTARARWYLFMPCTVTAGNQAMWRASIDHETYARVDGVWMFRHKRSEPLMNVPFETGWAETRLT
jgi:hypothetical protein